MNKPSLFLLLSLLCTSCSSNSSTEDPGAPVELSKAEVKTVPYVIRTIGNTEAYQSVDIRPQVSGELTHAYFTDGQRVNKDDLLFSIDSRPYAAQLEQAEGKFVQANSSLSYNNDRVERFKPLVPEEYVSELDYKQYVSSVEGSKGEVLESKGAIDQAKVNLAYCKIQAPISGRCGRRLKDPGNIVSPKDPQPLLTINQISPLYAYFTVPEQDFPLLQKAQKNRDLDVDIEVVGEKLKATGKLDFLDNQVDRNTGTLLVRALIPNKEETLWPGQFIHVVIHVYEIDDAVVIPTKAVKMDTKGPYVFVTTAGQTVEKREVTLGQQFDQEQVILQGVLPGDTVVTKGQLGLRPGMKYYEAKQ